MRFGLLGELAIEAHGGPISIAAPKQRALLALLLLQRGRALDVERIAAELWGDEPPATATKTVQVYVAQLRKQLGDGVIVTRGRAYAVDLDGHELDVARFEALVEDGRRQLEAGDNGAAGKTLREALGLWRGSPLADFTYEEFAQAEIARLDEERMAALESRIDADLGRGAGEELVGELRALVAKHPLRERLQAQLMLALYRSGRQAEALEVYRDARRVLRDQLGLEPSPSLQELEQAILKQDESLGSVSKLRRARAASQRRPALLAVAGGALLLAAVAAALVVVLTRSGKGGISAPIAAGSVAAIDPGTGDIVGQYPVGASPAAVSVDPSGAWVLSADDKTVSRVEPGGKVRTIGIGAFPTDVVAGAGGIWVGTGSRFDQASFAGWVATSVARLNPETGVLENTVRLPQDSKFVSNTAAQHLAIARGDLWALAPDGTIARVDGRTGRVRAIRLRQLPVAIASDGVSVWVLDDQGFVSRVAESGRVTARIRVPTPYQGAFAVGGGSVWVTAPDAGQVWRIQPGLRSTIRAIDVGVGVDSIAYGESRVWAANSLNGTLSRIDPASNRVDRVVPIGNTPTTVAAGYGRVWVAVAGGAGAAPTGERRGSVVPLGENACSSPVSGTDPPRFLIASDLPLQGGPRFPTAQMSAAIQFVLREHGFRAGRFSLAYQSCDDSTAQTGQFDDAKCTANAKAYAANDTVIAVIGPYNSGCAFDQLGILNRAGLAMVSPTATRPALIRTEFDAPPCLHASLYPTGKPTFARVMPADDAESAAAAVYAQRLGAGRVYVIHDGSVGPQFAYDFRRAAERLGEHVVGYDGWGNRPKLDVLARRAAKARPDVVYVCGLIDTGVGEVLAAVRRAVGEKTPVVGCSGLLPAGLLFLHAGEAARGVYVTLEGLAIQSLGAAGRRFVHDFAGTQAGKAIDSAAVYAAEATEAVVAAIARSDGSRASVIHELLGAEVQGGPLGPLQLDRRGEPILARTTIVRIDRKSRTNAVQSYEGADPVAVIASPGRLLEGG